MTIDGFDLMTISGECITPSDLNTELLRAISIAV